MPKVQSPNLTDNIYWKRPHSRCLTDEGRQLLTAVRSVYRDIAQPSVTEHEDGQVRIYWVSPRRRTLRRPSRVLEAIFPKGTAPDGKGAVTCRLMRGGRTVAEYGDLTLEEMRPLVLELTDHWNRNVWQPNGYRKEDGPYLIIIQTATDTGNTGDTIWRVYRDNLIVKEGASYGSQQAMRVAETARNEVARKDKHHRANASRYRATLPHPRPIHYVGEPQPNGRPTTLCGKICVGGKKRGTRVHGYAGVDADAPGASVCPDCRLASADGVTTPTK